MKIIIVLKIANDAIKIRSWKQLSAKENVIVNFIHWFINKKEGERGKSNMVIRNLLLH